MSHHGFFQLVAALNGFQDEWLMGAIVEARDGSGKFDFPTRFSMDSRNRFVFFKPSE